MVEYKFISPVQATLDDNFHNYMQEGESDLILKYLDKIVKMCDKEGNLVEYIWEDDVELIEKVKSIRVTVEKIKGEPMGVAYVTSEQLTSKGLQELKDYLTGQYADGWGEGFEQRSVAEWKEEIEVEDFDEDTGELVEDVYYTTVEMYVSFWQSSNWYIELDSQNKTS